MVSKVIKQNVSINCSAKEVYSALTNGMVHAAFTGAPAVIDTCVGGNFTVWDNYASGTFVVLEEDKTIIQTWRASNWEEGVYSIVTFRFTNETNGVSIEFTHEHVPKEEEASISDGWKEFYWDPLKKYFTEQ